jgi:hypothetical protein
MHDASDGHFCHLFRCEMGAKIDKMTFTMAIAGFAEGCLMGPITRRAENCSNKSTAEDA